MYNIVKDMCPFAVDVLEINNVGVRFHLHILWIVMEKNVWTSYNKSTASTSRPICNDIY